MYSVNDVIAGQYRVLVVHPTPMGPTVCYCVRLLDGAMVTLECVSLNGALLPDALEQYDQAQRELLKANGGHHRKVEWFETESERGKVFHVVKAGEGVTIPSERLHEDVLTNRVESETDITVDIGHLTPNRVETPVPPPVSCVRVLRQGGLHLDVDIPPQYLCKGWRPRWRWMLVLVFTVIWLLLTTASAEFAYDRLKGEGESFVLQIVVVPCWIVGIWILYLTVSKPFVHEYLQITATHFKFIRWFESPCRRKGPSAFGDPMPTASFMDKLLLGQRRGRTADLGKAEIREATKNFVLMEGNRNLTFLTPLSGTEQQWLVAEVNMVLEDIRNLCLSSIDVTDEEV